MKIVKEMFATSVARNFLKEFIADVTRMNFSTTMAKDIKMTQPKDSSRKDGEMYENNHSVMIKLSPTMTKCLEYMKEGDGRLIRLAGGFWILHDEVFIDGMPQKHFGTQTLQALEKAGFVDMKFRHGVGPLEASLTPSQTETPQ